MPSLHSCHPLYHSPLLMQFNGTVSSSQAILHHKRNARWCRRDSFPQDPGKLRWPFGGDSTMRCLFLTMFFRQKYLLGALYQLTLSFARKCPFLLAPSACAEQSITLEAPHSLVTIPPVARMAIIRFSSMTTERT